MTLRPTSLIDLREKLVAISTRAGVRELEGWDAFQKDEIWAYDSEKDDRVCPVCQGFDYEPSMDGERVKTEFTQKEWINKPRTAHPHTHRDHTHNGYALAGMCRCQLTWLNYPQILTERLGREFEEVTG